MINMQEIKPPETFQMRLAESLKTMRDNPTDMLLWLGINVICGLFPILFVVIISFLVRSDVKPYKPIYEGDLFIFVTTLCAAAVGVYWEIEGKHFWNSRRISLILIVLIMLFSTGIYFLLKFEKVKEIMDFNDNYVWWFSMFVLLVSVAICLHLFSMRMSMNYVDSYAKEERERIDQLTEKSKKESLKTKSGENL